MVFLHGEIFLEFIWPFPSWGITITFWFEFCYFVVVYFSFHSGWCKLFGRSWNHPVYQPMDIFHVYFFGIHTAAFPLWWEERMSSISISHFLLRDSISSLCLWRSEFRRTNSSWSNFISLSFLCPSFPSKGLYWRFWRLGQIAQIYIILWPHFKLLKTLTESCWTLKNTHLQVYLF